MISLANSVSVMMRRSIILTSSLLITSISIAADRVDVSIDTTRSGPVISRHLFGQFAEHLGQGVYEGIWVGPNSLIPNTRGIRNDVVGALRALKVPNIRWPGGCFADYYHWRKGVGPKREVTLNPDWGGVTEPNTFGSHEFLDFAEQVGAAPYLSVNIGSGTTQEAADWFEYLTTPQDTTLAKERAANGHAAPYLIPFVGLGNESWDCGGNMSPDYYVNQMRKFSRFVRNYHPDLTEKNPMQKIAVGPGGDGGRWTEWTEAVMKAYKERQWSWEMHGLSLHNYTVIDWKDKHKSTNFGEKEYAQILQATLLMDGLIAKHSAIMDKYDPEKKVALVVDEWGAWYAPTPGTNPGFLMQQNSMRDAILAALNINIFARHADRVRMANIAQMINVLQAMILTNKEKMLLTPTYHIFKMYVPFQDAKFIPVQFDAGVYRHANINLPRIDVVAAKDSSGKIWISLTNVDPNQPAQLDLALSGMNAKTATGETLTAAKVDSINTFDAPNTVVPKAISIKAVGSKLPVTLPPKSVTVLSIQ